MKPAVRKIAQKIGNQIRSLREERKMSRRELAREAGIAPSALWSIERGESNFLISTLAKIACALGVHIADLWPDE